MPVGETFAAVANYSTLLPPLFRHAVQDAEGAKCHKDLVLKSSDLSVYKGARTRKMYALYPVGSGPSFGDEGLHL